jgi:topoisomerase IA-like protein
VKKSSKFSAHDEANAVKEGDTVQIIECAPISKNKRWTVVTGDVATEPKAEKKPVAKKAAPKKDAPEKEAAAKKTTTKKAPAKKTAAKKEDK